MLTEADWGAYSTTASGKDQHKADVCDIYGFVIAIDNNPISGFGTLSVQTVSNTINVVNHLQSVSQSIPGGWAVTGVGAKATWTGYGRLLYNMYAPSASQVVAASKDVQTSDVSGTVEVMASCVQPNQ
jgi:hypothetical protein